MIVSFKDFINKRKSDKINESTMYTDEDDIEYFVDDDIEEPECVTDVKFLSNITKIVFNKLKKNFDVNWNIYPFTLRVNGYKATMIYSKMAYVLCLKESIVKKIALFNVNPLDKDTNPLVVVESSKVGFSAMVEDFINLVPMFFKNGINESMEEGTGIDVEDKDRGKIKTKDLRGEPLGIYAKDAKPSKASIDTLLTKLIGPAHEEHGELIRCQGVLTKEKKVDGAIVKEDEYLGCPPDDVKAFLELFVKYRDSDVVNYMIASDFPEDSKLRSVQDALFRNEKGELDGTNKTIYVANPIHCILCGVTGGVTGKALQQLKSAWFFGAAQEGKLAVYYDITDGSWKVEVPEAVLDEEIGNLDNAVKRVKELSKLLFRYIKYSGKNKTFDRLVGQFSSKRALFVTGSGGLGKSRGIEEAIAASGARENIDYVRLTSAKTVLSIYKDLYRYNNMVIIYDDTDEYFGDKNKVSMFKQALQAKETQRTFDAPTANDDSGDFYDVFKGNQISRLERYKKEVGSISSYSKKEWKDKRLKQLKSEEEKKAKDYIPKDEDSPEEYTPISDAILRQQVDQDFEKYENDNRKQLFPNRFTYNGFIIFITNNPITHYSESRELKAHWQPLQGRMKVVDISPRQRVVWEWIKRKIKTQMEFADVIPDEMMILPKNGKAQNSNIENVMNFLEDVMSGKKNTLTTKYGRLDFRTIVALRDYLNDESNTEEKWKSNSLEDMIIESTR